MDNETVIRFNLSSPDIANDQPIAAVYTCDGVGQSPELRWDQPPPGTRSLALIVDDPDAPHGVFRHWGVFNIPDEQQSIERGAGNGGSNTNFVQAVNSFGKSGYGGPCPPHGDKAHRYRFKLYAVDVDRFTLPPDASVEQVEQEAQQHEIGLAELTATYQRR